MVEAREVPGCRVGTAAELDERLLLSVERRRPGGCCSRCGRPSRAGHGRYRRRPADLPSLGRPVRLDLEVRRLRCANPACPRRTFAERVPSLVIPRARRTRRLAEAQSRIGFATSAAAGARLARALAMPASASTVLRLMHAAPVPRVGTPRAVGTDDWAWRKGRSYGTLVVDLELRRPLDLLPDRSGSTLAAWLRRRPEITVVARDRSTECARAVTVAAPGALQVADRWHLLLNMRQAVERWLARSHGRLRRLPMPEGDHQPGQRQHAFRRTAPEIAAASRAAPAGALPKRKCDAVTWPARPPWL